MYVYNIYIGECRSDHREINVRQQNCQEINVRQQHSQYINVRQQHTLPNRIEVSRVNIFPLTHTIKTMTSIGIEGAIKWERPH